MDLEQGLTVELSSISGLAQKVFPISAEQGTKAPYLTYTLGTANRTMILTGYDGLVETQFQLDLYHQTYSGLMSLKKLIIQAIKTLAQRNLGDSGPFIQQAELINEFETYEDAVKLYKAVLEVEIDYIE